MFIYIVNNEKQASFGAGGGTLESRAGGSTLDSRAGGGTLESGLGAVPVERLFFQEKKWIYQEQSHRSETKNNRIERVLKNIGTIRKRMERNGNFKKICKN